MDKIAKAAPIDIRANVPPEFKPADWLIASPNRPPNSTTAISHRDVLYAAIGRVLTAWEVLETLLASEFQRLMGTFHISAMRAYGSVSAHSSRCDMLIAAAEIELGGEELETFKTCIADVRRLAGSRNLVAHGVVVSMEEDGWKSDDTNLPLQGPFLLMAAPYNTQKFKVPTGPSYIFSVSEIEQVLAEIKKMQARVGALSQTGVHHKSWRFVVY